MQLDATKAGDDNIEQSPSPPGKYIRLKPATTNVMDESDGEYESWGGFESGAYLVQHHRR